MFKNKKTFFRKIANKTVYRLLEKLNVFLEKLNFYNFTTALVSLFWQQNS